MDQVIEAAKMANAHEFITKFSNGYETSVGERGNP
jgi:ABC-type protease/lipase transport system fused ATPase/permease subunit